MAAELGRKYPQVQIQPVLDVLAVSCEICLADPLPNQICRDVSDDKFLACAHSAGVDVLVSGDKDLLAVSGFQGIEVVKLRSFLRIYIGEDD